MPHVVVHTANEHVDSSWTPGNSAWLVVDDAAQVLPATPHAGVVMHDRRVAPLVPQRVIRALGERIAAVCRPGRGGGTVGDDVAEIFPPAPRSRIPLVPHVVVHPAYEAVDAPRTPR